MKISLPAIYAFSLVQNIQGYRDHVIADYWCGPTTAGWCSGDPDPSNTVNDKVTDIHVSFAQINEDGSATYECGAWVDGVYQDCNFYEQQASGKKVLLSFGGAAFQEIDWLLNNPDVFASSAASIINEWGFDGVSMDIEHFETTDQISKYATVLVAVRNAIGPDKLLTDAPQCPYVYSGVSGVSGYYNLYVNLINQVGSIVDYFFVQEYNNWCNGLDPASSDYLMQVAKDWINPNPANNYIGLSSPAQFVMGVPASADPSTASSGYFPPSVLKDYLTEAQELYEGAGAGVWDALGDKGTYGGKASFDITDTIAEVYSSPELGSSQLLRTGSESSEAHSWFVPAAAVGSVLFAGAAFFAFKRVPREEASQPLLEKFNSPV